MSEIIIHDHNHDNVDRRGFLKCMAWAGTGVLFTMYGGVMKSYGLSQVANGEVAPAVGALSFVHISDSHLGFSKDANKDVVGTLQAAVDKINALPTPGSAPSPGPMKVPAEKLRSLLGITSVNYVQGKNALAIIDSPLAG